MKWLITGGCGFLGSALIHNLIADGGHEIRVVDDLSVGSPASLAGLKYALYENIPTEKFTWSQKEIQIFVSDIGDEHAAVALTAGADVIVHLAANTGVQPSVQNPRKDCITNVIGTFNYLDAARINQVRRFVFASSGAPVGEVTPPIHEEIVPHPVSPYGASKLCGEAYCSAFFKTYAVETVGLRFGNVYGPGSAHKSSVVARFLSAMMDGNSITIYGDGSQTRDFIHIGDLIQAIRAAAIVPDIGGEIFQIATSQETQVIEIAEMLRQIAISHEIAFPEIQTSGRLKGDVMRNYSDTSKARRVLGWHAKKKLQDGLEETFLWFKKEILKNNVSNH